MTPLPARLREQSPLGRLATWGLRAPAAAMVLGRTVHLWGVSRAVFLADARWRRHEACHLLQADRHGCVRFVLRYLWESLRHGYRGNRFEIEARRAETDPALDAQVWFREH